jgi:hypothetical protein
MQSFKIVAYLLLGYFWLVEEEEEGTEPLVEISLS